MEFFNSSRLRLAKELLRKVVDSHGDVYVILAVLLALFILTGCASYAWKVSTEGSIGPEEEVKPAHDETTYDGYVVPIEAQIW
jgi:flagellar basal body-associated protein FliL